MQVSYKNNSKINQTVLQSQFKYRGKQESWVEMKKQPKANHELKL